MTETREHFETLNALLSGIAKALNMTEDACAKALEDGSLTLDMGDDPERGRFLIAKHGTQSVRLVPDPEHGFQPPPDESRGQAP